MAQPPPPLQPIVVPPPPQPAAAAAAPPQPPNGSNAYFQGLTQNTRVLQQNYDFVRAFQRSIKVFRMSYPEITMANSPPNHTQKYQEYLGEMTRLYDQNQPNMSFLNPMNTDIRTLKYQIVISCKTVVGRDNLTHPKLVALLSAFQNVPMKRTLDMTREKQPYGPLRLSINFDNFTTIRSDTNYGLMLSIEERLPVGQQPHQQPLEQFNLIIANTHPEGFEDWIDFGRGVRLLINVSYKAKDEGNITSEMVSEFHLRTIEMMLRKRLQEFTTTRGNRRPFHQMAASKRDVCYRRHYIDRQTDSYFWPPSGPQPSIFGATPSWFEPSQGNLTPQRRTTIVRFIDMQIGFKTNEDFEDSVCLCSEWCNWNAFFYHNPIYRFLLVRHHQLFMQNMSNIPDMYLCVPVLLACEATPTIQKPILQLMHCANEYRKRYYDNFYLKHTNSNQFQQQYALSRPNPIVMDGLTYNKIRYDLNITELCHLLDPNPFADICIENLINYYNVLISLHLHMSSYTAFISDKRLWLKSMDILGRNKYNDYIKQSYTKCIAQFIFGHDSIFTDDYEYATRLPKTEAHREIRRLRDRVKMSPFNVSVRTDVFLTTFVSVYKFLSRVEPILPGAYKSEARQLVMTCYKRMDIDFDGLRVANNNLNFILDSTRSGFNFQQIFDLFYTLKLYFYSFEIQKHSITSAVKYQNTLVVKNEQVCSTFNFIWNYEFIERKYRNSYPGQPLFQIEDFETLFTDFYDTYWRRAQHETQQLQSLEQFCESVVFQYQRQHYWERNGGYNRQKFRRIMDSFIRSLTNIGQSSQLIFSHFWFSTTFLANTPGYPLTQAIANRPIYQYSAEMLDHLIYYLVKANCSIILSTVAKFMKPVHALQLNHLVNHFLSFSLCKPGWILLFTTMHSVMTFLDNLNNHNIVYDDEFNRISNTCSQTRKMVKDIYRQFYQKLCHEWITELCGISTGINQPPAPNLVQTIVQFMQLHLAYGVSFCAFFADDFRGEFHLLRKILFVRLNTPAQPNLQHRVAFANCLQVVRDYLRNRQLDPSAGPMMDPPWSTHLLQTLTSYNQMTGQQLNIDLNAADI